MIFLVIIFATSFWACQSEHFVCFQKQKGQRTMASSRSDRDCMQSAIWFYLIKWSLYYQFTDLSQTLKFMRRDSLCIYLLFSLFPFFQIQPPSAQALWVSSLRASEFSSHISLCASTKVYNIWFRELVPHQLWFHWQNIARKPFCFSHFFFVKRIFIFFHRLSFNLWFCGWAKMWLHRLRIISLFPFSFL